MDMATVVVKLLDGDYKDEGGMVADLRLMVENCRRCVAETANPGLAQMATLFLCNPKPFVNFGISQYELTRASHKRLPCFFVILNPL